MHLEALNGLGEVSRSVVNMQQSTQMSLYGTAVLMSKCLRTETQQRWSSGCHKEIGASSCYDSARN